MISKCWLVWQFPENLFKRQLLSFICISSFHPLIHLSAWNMNMVAELSQPSWTMRMMVTS